MTSPVKCTNPNAWLGSGYYFWKDEQDAIAWGITSKAGTGYYEIYKANIESDNILDTVFNQEHYEFWLKQIEKVGKNILKKTGIKPTIKEINEYFKERGTWDEIDGILFQDIPKNPTYLIVQGFYYRKRIQLVIYNINTVISFLLHSEGECYGTQS